MKNKSFENYYDHVHVDEHLLDQKKSYKHHYLKPILILSCCLLLSVCVLQSKQINKDTFEVIAYNQTYTSLTKESTPMDYYLIHDRVDIADKVQLKKKYEDPEWRSKVIHHYKVIKNPDTGTTETIPVYCSEVDDSQENYY